jgi:hypothetical protein
MSTYSVMIGLIKSRLQCGYASGLGSLCEYSQMEDRARNGREDNIKTDLITWL